MNYITNGEIESGTDVCPSCKSDSWKSAKMVVMEPFRSIPELERTMQYAHRHEGWDVMVQPEGEPLVGWCCIYVRLTVQQVPTSLPVP